MKVAAELSKKLDNMVVPRALAEVWASPAAAAPALPAAYDGEAGAGAGRGSGRRLQMTGKPGSKRTKARRERRKRGSRGGARGARGRGGRPEAAGWKGPARGVGEALESAGKWKVPVTSSASKQAKRKNTLKIVAWNCFGLSAERTEYLFGSEDGKKPGLFPAVGGGEWLVGLTECRGWEQQLAKTWPSYRLVVGDAPPESDPASGVAIVMSPGLGRAVRDQGYVGSRIAWVQLETEVQGVDIAVISVYVLHHGRTAPSADDTFAELGLLLDEFDKDLRKRQAVKILMGDMNGRLA